MADRSLNAPPRSRWISFVSDAWGARARSLHEDKNPLHRVRVEHNRDTLLVQLSDEDGQGWTVFAVDRQSRRWAVGEARRKLDASTDAFEHPYSQNP
jgi:hypothetical protein